MQDSLELSLKMLNAPSVLPRVLLLFARRRLTVRDLHMHSAGEWAHVDLRLDGVQRAEAEQICRQLRRIVEMAAVELVSPSAAA